MTSLFDNVDIVKAVKTSEFLLRQRCNIQISIENAKYIFLKMSVSVHILFRIPWMSEDV